MSTNSTIAGTVLALFDIAESRSRRSSGTSATPTFGSTVAKGYAAASALPPDKALKRDDLPALGRPTKPKRSTAIRVRGGYVRFGMEPVEALERIGYLLDRA